MRVHWLDVVAKVLESDTADLRALLNIAGGSPDDFYLGVNISGADLRGQDLRGIRFSSFNVGDVLMDENTLLDSAAMESQVEHIKPKVSAWTEVELLRLKIVSAFQRHQKAELVRRNRAFWNTKDEGIRVVVAISKRHRSRTQPYWYGYHENQIQFLREGVEAFFILGALDLDFGFAIPFGLLERLRPKLNSTKGQREEYWHLKGRVHGGKYHLLIPFGEIDVTEFAFPIEDPTP